MSGRPGSFGVRKQAKKGRQNAKSNTTHETRGTKPVAVIVGHEIDETKPPAASNPCEIARTNPAVGPHNRKTHERKPNLGGLDKMFRICRKGHPGLRQPKRDERTQTHHTASSKTQRTNPSAADRETQNARN